MSVLKNLTISKFLRTLIFYQSKFQNIHDKKEINKNPRAFIRAGELAITFSRRMGSAHSAEEQTSCRNRDSNAPRVRDGDIPPLNHPSNKSSQAAATAGGR